MLVKQKVISSDLKKEALKLTVVPISEDLNKFTVGESANGVEGIADLGDELHVTVLNALWIIPTKLPTLPMLSRATQGPSSAKVVTWARMTYTLW